MNSIESDQTSSASTASMSGLPSRWWIFPLLVWLVSRVWSISALYVGAAYHPIGTELTTYNPRAGVQSDLAEYYRDYAARMPEYGRYPMLGLQVGGRWESLSPFVHWDALWYLSIAEVGYHADPELKFQQNIAFFPLFPLAIRALHAIGLPSIPSAIVLANLSTLVACVMLFQLAYVIDGLRSARWSVLFWLFYPMGFFGSVPYADPLLAIGIIGALLAVYREKYLLAGLWGAIATAARPPAVALGWLFVPRIFRQPFSTKRTLQLLIGMALTGVGVAVYFAYLGYAFGDLLLYLHVNWYDPPKMSGLNPKRWLITLLGGILNAIKLLTNPNSPPLDLYSGRVADPFIYLWALCWLPSVRKLGMGVVLMTLVSFLLPLMTLETTASYGRYTWCIIPVFLMAGQKIGGKLIGWITLIFFALAQFVLAMWFGGGWPVI